MEKTIELLLVATVVLMTAMVVIFMLQGRIEGFDSFLEGQSQEAKCRIGETKYMNAMNCRNGNIQNPGELSGIVENYPNCNTSSWSKAC
ncbi:MAG: hypothetical protein ABEJ98_03735 [Candidatus Nanohaloarchaea archaeon]